MATKIQEKRHFLEAFNIVTAKGQKSATGYELDGIKAWHDFDGYTCWLSYKDVTITILFHGKYKLDFEKEESFDLLNKKINRMLTAYR
ncbi:DUF3081 domain-containing protein [Thalassotalea sp. LPB0316]|uniref:DUF3081 family protein n=1 Tax=Thalassotalea sp. LPB0316 TaxID=2769490 RepID=UPI00186628BE|nr:DUF3081 family protein [Thalassotalea sp. LPB0316]QOL25137.1 DUF3081 domain-containing protein [Thalassotalea sp. LPB0316]